MLPTRPLSPIDFEQIYRDYHKNVYNYIYGQILHREAAEDFDPGGFADSVTNVVIGRKVGQGVEIMRQVYTLPAIYRQHSIINGFLNIPHPQNAGGFAFRIMKIVIQLGQTVMVVKHYVL